MDLGHGVYITAVYGFTASSNADPDHDAWVLDLLDSSGVGRQNAVKIYHGIDCPYSVVGQCPAPIAPIVTYQNGIFSRIISMYGL